MQVLCSCNLSAIPAKFTYSKWSIGTMITKRKSIYTCPKCGHSVGWRRKLKAGGVWGRHWPCKNCGTLLGINPWNKILLLICIGALFLYVWIWPTTPFHFCVLAFSVSLGNLLTTIFVFPIVEKGTRQKSDSD